MKQRKPRARPSSASHNDLIFEEEIHQLADAISEKDRQAVAVQDPFEEYVDVMRSKIYTNPQIFRSRLAKGYRALLCELENEHINGD